MYAVVAGGGKVGANITRSLVRMGHEVTLVEQRRDRFELLEAELGPVVLLGDATEIHVLELAGIGQAETRLHHAALRSRAGRRGADRWAWPGRHATH